MVSRNGSALRRLALAALLGGCVLVSVSSPVAAQGFFDFLFGSSGPKQAAIAPAPTMAAARPIVLPGAIEYRPALRGSATGQPAPRPSGGPRFRTVCVRLCDGYYWPIRHDSTRGQFYRDAEACRSQCDNEVRLFFAPSPGADINAAVDQRGLAYASLETAFLYRKKRVAGCVCKPVPWSAREMNRHRTYALEEAAERRAAEADNERRAKLAEGPSEPEAGTTVVAPEAADKAAQSGIETPSLGDPSSVTTMAGSLDANLPVSADLPVSAGVGSMRPPVGHLPPLVSGAVREPRSAPLSSMTSPVIGAEEDAVIATKSGRHHVEPIFAAQFSLSGVPR